MECLLALYQLIITKLTHSSVSPPILGCSMAATDWASEKMPGKVRAGFVEFSL